jgi:hypothetical protein
VPVSPLTKTVEEAALTSSTSSSTRLAVNSRRSPTILLRHLPDWFLNPPRDPGTAHSLGPGDPAPEPLETLALPGDHRVGLHDDESVGPIAPDAAKGRFRNATPTWDVWLGPCPWRPYNSGYVNGGGWYHFYDFATDVAMWGAHTVAQALAGLDMTNVSFIEFQYDGPDATMVTRLSNGIKLVLFRVAGSVWEPCQLWHGACGERFDGPEGWVAAADGYSGPDVSSPALLREFKRVLADYRARTQRPLDHVRDFLDCIRSRRPPVRNPDVMYRSMKICLAADICERLKRNLKFDLRRAEFVDDPEANRLRSRAMRAPYMA